MTTPIPSEPDEVWTVVNLVFSLAVGILIGILASMAAWWILFHHFGPKIAFSHDISSVAGIGADSKPTYCVKIVNSGRRQIIDLEVIARIRIRGVDSRAPRSWHIIELSLSKSQIPRFKPGGDSTILVYPVDIGEFKKAIYPDQVGVGAHRREFDLGDLFRLGTAAELRVMIFGYDGFSGARKFFESHDYTADSVKSGFFEFEGLRVATRTMTPRSGDAYEESDRGVDS
jgi:hypothetical protein